MSDFYERNNIKRPMQNAKSRSECLDSVSREIMLRNAFNCIQSTRAYRGLELWVFVGRFTGNGSGYSQQICEELGWPYDMKIGPNTRLP